MKITGIILLVIGALSTLGALMASSQGHNASFAGLTFVVLGIFLIVRANKKAEEESQRRNWEEGNKKE